MPTNEVVAESGRKSTVAKSADSLPADQTSQATQVERASAKISPKARRLANELGINLADVRGSGGAGEILASDILAVANKSASPSSAATKSASPIARLMAERTTESWRTAPHFFLARDVNAAALDEARRSLGPTIENSKGIKLTHSDLLVALVARAVAAHRYMNSSWSADGVRQNPEINIGLAIAVDDGVIVPVIRNADKATIEEIAVQRHDLASRGRSGKLRPADLTGGTFTISNLGMFGVEAFTAIIIPPQAAILAVGAIVDRVVAVNGSPAVRPMMTLTLSSDHRVLDGARSAQFMKSLAQSIAEPSSSF